MKTILIPVIDKIAKSPDEEIVCGNSDYYIEFAFDSEWDGYDVKTARFVYGGKMTDVVFKGNVVQVPVMSNTTKVFVGVFSGDLRTSTPAAIVCRPSILCKGGTPHDPTPDVYAQIMDMMNSAVSPTVSVDDVAGGHRITITDVSGTKTFDVMDGAKGEKGDTGATGANGTNGTSVTVTNVSTSTADGGSNVVTFSDGKTLTVKNGSKGSTGAKGDKGDPYTLTEGDKATIVADVLAALPVAEELSV